MAAEYDNASAQNVSANSAVLFANAPVPCTENLVIHRNGSGIFRLANRFFRQNLCSCWKRNSNYNVSFGANLSIPEGGTVESISLAVVIDGEIDESAIMTVTPQATGDQFNVSVDVLVQVPFICTCSNVSVRNISTQAVTVTNANIKFDKA